MSRSGAPGEEGVAFLRWRSWVAKKQQLSSEDRRVDKQTELPKRKLVLPRLSFLVKHAIPDSLQEGREDFLIGTQSKKDGPLGGQCFCGPPLVWSWLSFSRLRHCGALELLMWSSRFESSLA